MLLLSISKGIQVQSTIFALKQTLKFERHIQMVATLGDEVRV